MDEIVARSLAKWPNVPAVYGWLALDRRGKRRGPGTRGGLGVENNGQRRVARLHWAQLPGLRKGTLVFPERAAAGLRLARVHAARGALRGGGAGRPLRQAVPAWRSARGRRGVGAFRRCRHRRAARRPRPRPDRESVVEGK